MSIGSGLNSGIGNLASTAAVLTVADTDVLVVGMGVIVGGAVGVVVCGAVGVVAGRDPICCSAFHVLSSRRAVWLSALLLDCASFRYSLITRASLVS